MLTSLSFHNWRSLKDVTIDDLTPITVFIGANSSGKTNIIDALKFWQEGASRSRGYLGAIRQRGGVERILTVGQETTSIECSFTYQAGFNDMRLSNLFKLVWHEGSQHPSIVTEDRAYDQVPVLEDLPDAVTSNSNIVEDAVSQYTKDFISLRWQILEESFSPRLSLSREENIGDLYLIEPNGRNLPTLLAEMMVYHPHIYKKLQQDLQWLLSHVDSVATESNERENRVVLREHTPLQKDAATVSAGTSRLLAMLTAYYSLDMNLEMLRSPFGVISGQPDTYADMPALVIIEEPDTALNPGILGKFVELLRDYSSREVPCQFLLTTHNPSFLDHFKPEEVRVVSRGEDGYTRVDRVPDSIKDIWLDEYGLGEVWQTNAFGGLPE